MPVTRAGTGPPSATEPRIPPWLGLALLVALLAGAVTVVSFHEPQRLFDRDRPPVGGLPTMALFALVYAACAVALVPRPVLSLGAGALFGATAGIAVALTGTVLSAAVAFGMGRVLGQQALRGTLLRGRLTAAGDRELTERGFRAVLVMRLVPVVPFALVNYCAAVSRMPWRSFVGGTALGCLPGVTAYAVAGSRAAEPTSPGFLLAATFLVVSGVLSGTYAVRRRRLLTARADPLINTRPHVPHLSGSTI